VLRAFAAELDDTVPALRPPNLYDLMLHAGGYAHYTGPDAPITRAVAEAVSVRMPFTPHAPDEYLKRVGALPLVLQPGERFHYGMSTDLLGVVIARASGQSLGDFLAERIFGPGHEGYRLHRPGGQGRAPRHRLSARRRGQARGP